MSTTAILPFPPLPSLAGSAAEPVPSGGPAMATLPDRALLERVARGDADAFTALYRRYERPVFGVLLRLAGGRRALAEEWLQEAFTRVWLGAATHDPSRGEVRPWIYKIALNTARSELARKRHRTPHVSLDEAGLDLPDERAGEKRVAARLDEARRAEAVARRAPGAAGLHAGGGRPPLQPGAVVRRDRRGDRRARRGRSSRASTGRWRRCARRSPGARGGAR